MSTLTKCPSVLECPSNYCAPADDAEPAGGGGLCGDREQRNSAQGNLCQAAAAHLGAAHQLPNTVVARKQQLLADVHHLDADVMIRRQHSI